MGKHLAGIDEISDYVVKKCVEAIKNSYASLEFGIYRHMLQITKENNFIKYGERSNTKLWTNIQFMCFLKILPNLRINDLKYVNFFLSRNNILTKSQNEFRKEDSNTILEA
jgi:hypothetical protein